MMRRTSNGRRSRVRLAAGLVALALPLVAACAPAKKGPADSLYARVNEIRAQNGAGPLAACGPLVLAADAHARDMAAHGLTGHTGSDGSGPGQRINRFGYIWSHFGEVVAPGARSADEAFAIWMASGGHRGIVLDRGFQHVGFAVAGDRWVGVFGAGAPC